MVIPKKVKIGGVTWSVQFVDGDSLDTDGGTCGDTCPSLQRIRINKDLTQEMKEQTYIHELLHACNFEMSHSEVELLSTLLHQILVQSV